MNAKILTAVVAVLMLVPAGLAVGYRFGSCSYASGYSTSCVAEPNASGEPPALVTGHTVYAKFIINATRVYPPPGGPDNQTLFLPTDFAAIAGYFAINRTDPPPLPTGPDIRGAQRECVVWFNGQNLDQEPDPDEFSADDGNNAFPSDEDENALPHGQGQPYDDAMQDYDFDRDVDDCDPEWAYFGGSGGGGGTNFSYFLGLYAAAVEKGDCNPASGSNFRYRGHLDFTDPNGIYHEVQEYDYNCGVDVPKENPLCISEEGDLRCSSQGAPTGAAVSGIVNQLFPWTYTDAHNEFGCTLTVPPPGVTPGGPGVFDVINNTTVDASFDLGHKCNGTIQDLFKERLWMTQVHTPVSDPTIGEYYTFALQVDTCAGVNMYEFFGKQTDKDINNSSSYYEWGPRLGDDSLARFARHLYTDTLEQAYLATDPIRDTFGPGVGNLGLELLDWCTDGSSFSFDDTFRGRTVHDATPVTTEEIMRGNSFEDTVGAPLFGKHREVCRDNMDAPNNFYPDNSPYSTGADCYPEDHKTAFVDLYVFDVDPTGGLFTVNGKGLTTSPQPAAWQYVPPAGYP